MTPGQRWVNSLGFVIPALLQLNKENFYFCTGEEEMGLSLG